MNTSYDQAVAVLRRNIRETMARAKRQDITGMSFDCLKADTPTTGLACSESVYNVAFQQAVREVASGIE